MKRIRLLAWTLWGLATLFYLYEFMVRVTPSVIVPELMRTFSVDAAALGTLSAFYLYIYAPMQIPAGLLMDRFGARKLLTIASAVVGVGSLLFSVATELWVAEAGRLLMGAGSAYAYIGLLWVSAHWFPPIMLPFVMGLGSGIGMVGAIAGEIPFAYASSAFGWRPSMFGIAIIGFLLAGAIYFALRKSHGVEHKIEEQQESIRDVWEGIKVVCRNWKSWVVAFASAAIYVTTSVFAGLWAPPFLEASYGLSSEAAGTISSMIFLGWILGGPAITYLAMVTHKRRLYLILGGILGAAAMCVILFATLSLWLLYLCFLIVGLASAAQILSYTIAIEINPRKAKGMAIALTNFFTIAVASAFQPIVGAILDATDDNYTLALIALPISFLLCSFFALFIKRPPEAHPA